MIDASLGWRLVPAGDLDNMNVAIPPPAGVLLMSLTAPIVPA